MWLTRIAASLLVAYALLLTAGALHYYSWSGDTSDLPRCLVRVVGVGLLAYGLCRVRRWAWWLSVVGGGLLGAIGLFALAFAIKGNLFAERPNPMLDYVIVGGSATTLLAAVMLLLLPASRAEFRKAA